MQPDSLGNEAGAHKEICRRWGVGDPSVLLARGVLAASLTGCRFTALEVLGRALDSRAGTSGCLPDLPLSFPLTHVLFVALVSHRHSFSSSRSLSPLPSPPPPRGRKKFSLSQTKYLPFHPREN